MSDPAPRPRRGRLRRLLTPAVLVAVVAVAAWVLWTRRAEVGDALATIGAARAVLSLAPTLVAVALTALCWRVWLGAFGARPPLVATSQVFFVTQAGKYLPGSVWPFLAQAALARRMGLARSAVLTATALFLLTHVVTGTALGLASAGVAAVERPWLVGCAAGLAALTLLPPVQRRLLALVRRLRPSLVTPPGLTWARTGAAVASMLGAWACYGLATFLVAAPLGASGADLWLVTGAYALAWVVGFLVVAAPAGAGAREAVLITLLTPLTGAGGAIAVAVVSRLAGTVADLLLAAVSVRVLDRSEPDAGGVGAVTARPAPRRP
ncbi:MAG: lysylphosphatidylglycerol synthase domain-containing protein [Kineosporiaceae bacterium]